MTTNTNAALPDAVRVPLDSLHADAEYLCARLLDKSLTREEVVTAIRSRIDAAKAALTTAAAVPTEGWVRVPAEPTPEIVKAIDGVMWPGASEKAYRAMLAAAPKAEPVPAGEYPAGAIVNGRTLIDQLETYGFECEAGTLLFCADWHELKRCFEHLADNAQTAPAAVAGPSSDKLMALSKECQRMPGGLGMHYENYARAVLARWGAAPTTQVAPQPLAHDMRNAYVGAREDLAIWKRRALVAERDLRTERETISSLVAELNAANGPTHMGDAARLELARLRSLATHPAAPVAQGDAWRDLLWQIADALECTPCTADEVLPKVLTIAEEAARYRWLRDVATDSDEVARNLLNGTYSWDSALADAAIDAARSQAKEGA